MNARSAALSLLLLTAGCGSQGLISQIDLMETPALFANGDINPFPADLPKDRDIPYVTQRVPSAKKDRIYSDTPSIILRVGHAAVAIGPAVNLPYDNIRRRHEANFFPETAQC